MVGVWELATAPTMRATSEFPGNQAAEVDDAEPRVSEQALPPASERRREVAERLKAAVC
jgi:hypothetical protein